MTPTNPSDVDTSIPEVWAARVMRNTLRKGFWGKFAGGVGSEMPIIQQTELLNKPGDRIHIQITDALVGAGVSGDTATLEGQEEALATTEMIVSPTLKRHAVLINRRANKKSIVELRPEARMRLEEWGKKKVDDTRFSQFVSITNSDIPENTGYDQPNQYTIGSGFTSAAATTVDDIAVGDKLTVAACRAIRYHLMSQNARPFHGPDEQPFYGMVISPEMEFDLKSDSEYKDVLLNAAQRGSGNPLFTGAVADIEGLLLYPHFHVPTVTNATSVRVAKALAFGAEAFVEGWDEDVSWVEDTFDYDLQWGVAYSFAFQPRRALEKNSMLVLAAATVPTT